MPKMQSVKFLSVCLSVCMFLIETKTTRRILTKLGTITVESRLSGYPIIRTYSSQFLITDLKTEGAATVTRYGVRLSSLLKEMYSSIAMV